MTECNSCSPGFYGTPGAGGIYGYSHCSCGELQARGLFVRGTKTEYRYLDLI